MWLGALLWALQRALPGAHADDAARAWETLYDARLVEATDGTPEVAAMYYEELVGELRPTDPLYGPAWYWLGRTRYVLGDGAAAAVALQQAVAHPSSRVQAGALLSRIELEQRAISSLPFTLGFDGSTGPFVRAWEQAEKGTLEARTVAGRSVMAWGTTVRAGEPDHVAVALGPALPITAFACVVQSAEFPAELRVTVTDAGGLRYRAPVFQVAAGTWQAVDLPLAAFRSTEGGREGRGLALRPADRVALVEIEDLTGLLTPQRGENTLHIDTFGLR